MRYTESAKIQGHVAPEQSEPELLCPLAITIESILRHV